ncbi:biotin--[acetyl-CoA-carboxylase] ligase [Halolamina rubra]|uniref:biotin--[acetyl-CoA-carboxylase] ligase n=1 Tax=Halolamina rubra TaxID=1380430 RepID=UPI000679AF6D|nr:biotin--[acetyl-CoA-carboxylase] ligase [Halolamina rubra]
MTDTRRALLDALADGPVAGPELADRLGVSRAAVWKQVEALREAGLGIESVDDGYRVTDVPEFGGAAIEFGLDAAFDVEFHDSIGSTNERARELAAEGRADVAIVADEQTAGRGRLDRGWTGPAGGIYTSLLLRPDAPPAHAPVYTLAAAVAVTRAAREAGVDASIKWPNDVLVTRANESQSDSSDDVLVGDSGERGGRKLCGILTEMEGEADRVAWLIVGVGVNANVGADALPEGATSLQIERGEPVDRRAFTQRLLETYDELRSDPDSILDAWREHAATLGQRVRVDTPGGEIVGAAVDVEFPGALVVETDDGERERVTAGDCEHLRPV